MKLVLCVALAGCSTLPPNGAPEANAFLPACVLFCFVIVHAENTGREAP